MKEEPEFGIPEAVEVYAEAEAQYEIQGRGRPERAPYEAAKRKLSRQVFGTALRNMRNAAGLTLSRAAELAKIASPRKLSQYETTCYPPGYIIKAIAPHYRVSEKALAEMVLAHSDPDLFRSITGRRGFQPARTEIEEYLKQTNVEPSAQSEDAV